MIKYSRPCVLCGNKRIKQMRLMAQYGDTHRVLCLNCGAVFFATKPAKHTDYGMDYVRFFMNPADYLASVRRATRCLGFKGYLKHPLDILEIGAGSGVSLRTFKDLGYKCEGVDVDPEACKHFSEKMGVKITPGGFLDFKPSKQYNIIFGSHVLEHLDDPKPFMEHALTLLTPDGYMYLEGPNMDCSEGYRWDWWHFQTRDIYEHLCLFGQTGMLVLCEKTGWALRLWKMVPDRYEFRAILTPMATAGGRLGVLPTVQNIREKGDFNKAAP